MLSRLFKSLAESYRDWRRRERAFNELSALDDRSLADLGISRAEIPYAVAKIPVTAAPIERKAPTIRRAA